MNQRQTRNHIKHNELNLLMTEVIFVVILTLLYAHVLQQFMQ